MYLDQAVRNLATRIKILDNRVCCLSTNLCDDLNLCLGISSDGSDSLFLNQQGNFVSAGVGGSQDLQQVTDTGSVTNNNVTFDGVNGNGNTLFINGASINIDYSTNGNLYFTDNGSTLTIQPITTFNQSYVLSLPLNNGTLTTSVNGVGADNSGNIQLSDVVPNNGLMGDGVTSNFTIAHGLSYTPSFISVTFKNAVAASGLSVWLDWDATNIQINFASAPSLGSIDLQFFIRK